MTAEYIASEALVLPVEAQAARFAPMDRACVKAADMPLSLKLPGRIHALVLQEQRPGFQPHVGCDRVGLLEQGLSLADGDHVLRAGEWQQFVKPPDTAKPQRLIALLPPAFQVPQPPRYFYPAPVIRDVQQIPAERTGDMNFANAEGAAAVGGDALLERDFSETLRHGTKFFL